MKEVKYLLLGFLMFIVLPLIGQFTSNAKYRPLQIPVFDYLVSQDIADFNKDQLNDIVIARLIDNEIQIQIKLNEGDSLQNSLSKIDTISDFSIKLPDFKNSVFITTDDIDGDGDIDLYVGEVGGFKINASIGVLENKSFGGNISFVYRSIEVLEDVFVLAVPSVVDLDKDGKKDLIISDFDGRLTFYKNNGSFRFTEIISNPFSGHQFTSSVSFVEMSSENQMGLLAYTYEEDFQFFPEDPNQIGKYTIDTTIQILRNPDTLRTKFYQPRFKDVDNDGNEDLFLSALTFSDSRGYYTDSWLFPSTAFGLVVRTADIGCVSSDAGEVYFAIKNGSSPYRYNWVNTSTLVRKEGVLLNETETLKDLDAGKYEITITDSRGNKSLKQLEIYPVEEMLLEKQICAGEEFESYATSGVYTDMFTNTRGCDSIRVLDLKVLPKQETFIQKSICEGTDYNGYEEPGEYKEILKSTIGCDSTINLTLNVLPKRTTTEVDTSICLGESYLGRTVKGDYIDVYDSYIGCDSLVITHLSILEASNPLCKTTAVQEISKTTDLSVSPNPTYNNINIKFKNINFLNTSATLHSINGDLILKKELKSDDTTISLKTLASGIYLLIIETPADRYIQRVIKI